MSTSSSAKSSGPDQGPTRSVWSTPQLIAIYCLAIILALTLGVGLATGLVLRHLVQTLPLWAAVVFGFRRSSVAAWIAAPCFLFWLVLIVVIWAFLLGIAHVINGTFQPIEIAMTIVVALACLAGLLGVARSRSSLSVATKAVLFILMAVLQFACFRISFLPSIANR